MVNPFAVTALMCLGIKEQIWLIGVSMRFRICSFMKVTAGMSFRFRFFFLLVISLACSVSSGMSSYLIVGIATVTVERTLRGQAMVHPFEYLRIVFRTLNKVHFKRNALGSGDQLHLHTIEVLTLGSVVAPIPFALEQLTVGDTDVVAGPREGIDNVLHSAMEILEHPADSQKDKHQQLL